MKNIIFLFVCLLILVNPLTALAGMDEITFIYKPRYVSSRFITEEVKYKKAFYRRKFHNLVSVSEIPPEGRQEFIKVRFSGYVKTFKPDVERFIKYLIKEIDTIENGIKLLGHKNKMEFCQRYSIKKDKETIETKVRELLEKDKYIDEYFALSSNSTIKVFNKRNFKKEVEGDDQYSPRLWHNHFYQRYLDLEDSGWLSGYPIRFSPVFKGNLLASHMEVKKHRGCQEVIVWMIPDDNLSLKTEYEQRIVLPKYLGKRGKNCIFALVIADTLGEKKRMYEKLKVVYLMPKERSIIKMANEMKEDLSNPQTLITNDSLGVIKLGSDVSIIQKVAKGDQHFHNTLQNKGDYAVQTAFLYSKEGYPYSDPIFAAEYKGDKRINCIYTGDASYATVEGIMPTIFFTEFVILTQGNYQWVTGVSKVAFGCGESSKLCVLPQYPNMVFVFSKWHAGKGMEKENMILSRIYIGRPQ